MDGPRLTRFLLALVAALLAADLASRPGAAVVPSALAQDSAVDGRMCIAVAPGNGQGQNVFAVLDPASARLAIYEHRAGSRLELVTVRNLEFDLRLQQFPKDGPRAPVPSVESMRKP